MNPNALKQRRWRQRQKQRLEELKAKEKLMQSPLCAVYDKKIGMFDPPFMCVHTGEAIRDFENVKKQENTKFHKNPEDFDLYQLGSYDQKTGKLIPMEPHMQLATGV